jgi:hypothetical protein
MSNNNSKSKDDRKTATDSSLTEKKKNIPPCYQLF